MFKRILVPLDASPLAECVLPHAVAMATALDASVTILHVCEPRPDQGDAPSVNAVGWRLKTLEAEGYLDGVATRLREQGVQVQSQRLEGRAAEQIISYARQQGIDLIALSSHGRSGLSGWNVSGVVQKIIARSRISTLVVRAYQPAISDLGGLAYSRLLCPLDGSQRAASVVPVAAALARAHGGEVLLAHVVRRPEMPRRWPLTEEEVQLINRVAELNRLEAEQFLDGVRDALLAEQVTARSIVEVSETPSQSLHELVSKENVDLVLMSAHGHTGSTRLPYGSLALNFVVYGTTPLLIAQDVPADQIGPSQAEIAAGELMGR